MPLQSTNEGTRLATSRFPLTEMSLHTSVLLGRRPSVTVPYKHSRTALIHPKPGSRTIEATAQQLDSSMAWLFSKQRTCSIHFKDFRDLFDKWPTDGSLKGASWLCKGTSWSRGIDFPRHEKRWRAKSEVKGSFNSGIEAGG